MTDLDQLKTPPWARSILERARSTLSHSDTLRRFVSLASWTLVSFALEKAAMLVIVFGLAKILGAEDYGRLTLAQGMVNSLQIFIILGMGSILARYVPAMLSESVLRAAQIVSLCAVIVLGSIAAFTAAALLGGKALAINILVVPVGSPLPYWILAWIILSVVTNLLLIVMLSFEKGRALALVSSLGAGASIGTVPAMAAIWGLEGAVIALVAVEATKVAALSALYGSFLKAEGVRILTPPNRSDLPLLIKFGLPTLLTSIMWPTTIWLSQFILRLKSPNGLADVGVLGIALSLLGLVVSVSSLTNRAAFPIMSSLEATGSHKELKRLSGRMALAQGVVAALIGIPIAVATPYFMSSLGHTFASQWPVAVAVIGVGITTASMTALGNYLLIVGRAQFLTVTMAAWSACVLAGTALSSSAYGARGFAVSFLVATIIRLIVIATTYNASKILDGDDNRRQISHSEASS